VKLKELQARQVHALYLQLARRSPPLLLRPGVIFTPLSRWL
jgi:hypothetical protein